VALILPPPVAKLAPGHCLPYGILQPLAEKLPWAHHVILSKRSRTARPVSGTCRRAVENGWSRAVARCADRAARSPSGGPKRVTNFAATLRRPQSDLAQQTLKDPYVFDFLALDAAACERELEHGLIDHVQKFLVTLGAGFAFVAGRLLLSANPPTNGVI